MRYKTRYLGYYSGSVDARQTKAGEAGSDGDGGGGRARAGKAPSQGGRHEEVGLVLAEGPPALEEEGVVAVSEGEANLGGSWADLVYEFRSKS